MTTTRREGANPRLRSSQPGGQGKAPDGRRVTGDAENTGWGEDELSHLGAALIPWAGVGVGGCLQAVPLH